MSEVFADLAEGGTIPVGLVTAWAGCNGGAGTDVVPTFAAVPPHVVRAIVAGDSARRSRVTSLAVTFITGVAFAFSPATAIIFLGTMPLALRWWRAWSTDRRK